MKEQFEFASKLKEALGMNGKENITLTFMPDKQIFVYETNSGKDLQPDNKNYLEYCARKVLGDNFGGFMSKEEYEQKYQI